MRAYVLPEIDLRPELRDMPAPTPEAGEVLIRVLSSSVNPVDAMVAGGFFRTTQEYRFPAIVGRDVCGVVEGVGADVTRFRPGQTVWGYIKRPHIGNGTFAEFVACDASRNVALKPPNLPVIDAGSMAQSAVTALECLDVLRLTAGDTVLVNGATGGVGGFAVQIAAARGLRVIATGRPGASDQYLRDLGAHEVVDWTTGALEDAVQAVHPDGIDGVLDFVRHDTSAVMGSDATDRHAQVTAFMSRVLHPGGRFSSTTEGASEGLVRAGVGFNVHSEPTPANLDALNDLIERGLLRGCVTAVYPLERIAEAFEHQRSAGRGKTAVVVDEELWNATQGPLRS